LPPSNLANSVVRQVVHISLGGPQIKLQLSNLNGESAVTINSVHVALCKATPSVDSTIDTTTDTALSFSGMASVTIPAGKEIWSDAVDFPVDALANVSITMAVGSSVPSTITGHAGSRANSYQQTNSTDVSAASMASAQMGLGGWWFISGIQVLADASARAVVALGDSLTDGRGTTDNMNNRWTDDLSALFQGNPATANVAMMNEAIGGSDLIGTTGTAAQARFARDVLGQAGVKYVIVFDGINDIGSSGKQATDLESAYTDLINRAHGAGLLIYGATITPFGSNSYYTAAHEQVRQAVNTWIKNTTMSKFDGVLDFDAVVTDNGSPPSLQSKYDTLSSPDSNAQTDGLHMNPAGYQALANSVDLTLFTK